MTAMRPVHLLLLVSSATALRRTHRSAHGGVTDTVACPVLSSLVSAGHLKADKLGRVPADMVKAALTQTGSSSVFAAFQTAGIVGFLKNDTHQKVRMAGPKWKHNTDMKYVNLHTMNPLHTCTRGMRNTAAGYPCNLNTPYQQHGYSTRIMDPTSSANAEKRFWDWFGAEGVLTPSPSGGRELTVKGLGKLLKRARARGDLSGENSLSSSGGLSGSKMAFFHPSVSSPAQYRPLSQWQAQLAWAGFWVAFARKRNGVGYMPLSDLKDMFLSGKFPTTWKKRNWGLGTMFNWLPGALKGTGAGDEFIKVVEGMMAKVGKDADEATLYRTFLGALAQLGAFEDAVSNPNP
jgi:hypothetical protein